MTCTLRRLVVFALISFPTIWGVSSLWAKPKIEIPESDFIFGATGQHVNVYHTFWIKSVGDEPLVISHIYPGCGCTKAPVEDSVLAPGDSTRLMITLDTRSFLGHTVKMPAVRTNADTTKRELRMVLEISEGDPSGLRPLGASDFKIDVSQFTRKPRRTALFTLYNRGETDFKLGLVEKSGHDFEVELPPTIPAGDSVVGKVIVNEASLDKEFDGSFTIASGVAGEERMTLAVNRIIRIKD